MPRSPIKVLPGREPKAIRFYRGGPRHPVLLAAIKNVGEGAVESIIEIRNESAHSNLS